MVFAFLRHDHQSQAEMLLLCVFSMVFTFLCDPFQAECVNRSYVLAQGPLSHTTPHFWLMIWQQKIKGVIMLNKIIEKNQVSVLEKS